MQPPPPTWNQPPGRPVPATASLAQRYATLGTTCLVLSILDLLYCAQRVVSQVFSRTLIQGQRALMPTLPGAPRFGGMMDAAEAFMARIAVWEAVRTVPFVIATGFLLWIALRLRRGDAAALGAARTWMFGAFAAIAVSLLVQILVTVPATMDYQRHIVDAIPMPKASAAAPPIDIREMTSSITMVSTIFGLVGGTLFLAAWPIVLYVWAGKLQRDTAGPQRS